MLVILSENSKVLRASQPTTEHLTAAPPLWEVPQTPLNKLRDKNTVLRIQTNTVSLFGLHYFFLSSIMLLFLSIMLPILMIYDSIDRASFKVLLAALMALSLVSHD